MDSRKQECSILSSSGLQGEGPSFYKGQGNGKSEFQVVTDRQLPQKTEKGRKQRINKPNLVTAPVTRNAAI